MKSDNIKIMVCDKTDEVFEEPFESLLSGYQIGLEHPWEVANLSLSLFIYCATNAME